MEKGKQVAFIKDVVEQNTDSTTIPRSCKGTNKEIAEAYSSTLDRGLSRLRPRKEVPFFREVEFDENDSKRILGMRLKVYWPDSRKWFLGTVTSFDHEKGLHQIHYADGDREDLDLKFERFELEIKPSDGFKLKNERQPNKELQISGAEKAITGSLTEEPVRKKELKQPKVSLDPKKNKALKKGTRRCSRPQVDNHLDGQEAEKLLFGMDEDAHHEKVIRPTVDEINDMQKAGHACSEKEHDEFKTLAMLAREAKKSSTAWTMKKESSSEKPKLGSNEFMDSEKHETAQPYLYTHDRGSLGLRPRKQRPSFRAVELDENDNERILGMRLNVYWPDSRKWFPGTIKSFNNKNGLHTIYYDDGDEEDLHLMQERFELGIRPGDYFRLRTGTHSKNKPKCLGGDRTIAVSSGVDSIKMTPEPKKNVSLKRVPKKSKSKTPAIKDNKDKEIGDVLLEMYVDEPCEIVNKSKSDGVNYMEEAPHTSFGMECDKSNTIVETEMPLMPPTQIHRYSRRKHSKLWSVISEENMVAINADNGGAAGDSPKLPTSGSETITPEGSPEFLLKKLKTVNRAFAGGVSMKKELVSESVITVSHGLQQTDDTKAGINKSQNPHLMLDADVIDALEERKRDARSKCRDSF